MCVFVFGGGGGGGGGGWKIHTASFTFVLQVTVCNIPFVCKPRTRAHLAS